MDCNENGDCICKHGFGGSKCDKCKEGFTGNKCNICEANITGHNCNQCKLNYFNYPLCQGMSQRILFLKKSLHIFFISECVCNSNGSTTLECGKNNGVCTCKEGFAGIKCQECMPNVVGDECDTCEPGFFAYPSCQEGLSKRMIHFSFKSQDFVLFQNVNVILMVQQLWTVVK